MKKAIIYGTGRRGRQVAELLGFEYEILGFCDEKCQEKELKINAKTYPIFSLESLKDKEFDKVFVALFEMQESLEKLISKGVEAKKVDLSLGHFSARIDFIRSLSLQFKKFNVSGSVAELGVFQGDFAKYINQFFESKFYLFDTFKGFDERDLQKEAEFSDSKVGEFSDTSLELVKAKMPHLERCEFIQGFFPQSAFESLEKGVLKEDESFAFVNLDMDLYEPIKAGLEFFYPRITQGGGDFNR